MMNATKLPVEVLIEIFKMVNATDIFTMLHMDKFRWEFFPISVVTNYHLKNRRIPSNIQYPMAELDRFHLSPHPSFILFVVAAYTMESVELFFRFLREAGVYAESCSVLVIPPELSTGDSLQDYITYNKKNRDTPANIDYKKKIDLDMIYTNMEVSFEPMTFTYMKRGRFVNRIASFEILGEVIKLSDTIIDWTNKFSAPTCHMINFYGSEVLPHGSAISRNINKRISTPKLLYVEMNIRSYWGFDVDWTFEHPLLVRKIKTGRERQIANMPRDEFRNFGIPTNSFLNGLEQLGIDPSKEIYRGRHREIARW